MRIKQSLMISSGFLLFILFPAAVVAQTVADSGYVPSVKNASGNSCNPVILFDAGHHNFHSVKESAFSVPENALCMMQFTAEHTSRQPDTAWVVKPQTPVKNLKGYCQGALLEYGRGRMAVFGEAAMFTAQVAGGVKMGFGSPNARNNEQFALNVIHWLCAK